MFIMGYVQPHSILSFGTQDDKAASVLGTGSLMAKGKRKETLKTTSL